MAELNYGRVDGADAAGLPGLGQVINFSGAVISLALVAGLAWWGYQLMVRDVSGVPVIRALEGPMRVAPDDPGGELAVHTGLAVNDVPANGIAAEPAERLELAGDSNALASEDLAAEKLAERLPAQDVLAAQPVEDASATRALSAEETGDAEAGAAPADRDSLISAALTEATGAVSGPDGSQLELIPAEVPGVTRSLLPAPRPSDLTAIVPPPVGDDGFVFVAPTEIPEGTRLAQLGAFESEAVARQEWARLAGLFPEFMTDKARVIEQARSGGKMFYRLRAHGFEDLNDARRFCAGLVAENANCIPVRQR